MKRTLISLAVMVMALYVIGQDEISGDQETPTEEVAPAQIESEPAAPEEPAAQDQAVAEAEKAAKEAEVKKQEVKAQPTAKEEAEKKQAEEKKKKIFEEGEGISTLDLEGGNWLLKRQALEKTIDALERINKIFTTILDQRLNFLAARNKADHDFDVFVLEIGVEIGDLSQLLTTLEEDLEQERKKQGDLTEQEREALDAVEKKSEELKHLQAELKKVTELDESLDDVIMQVEKEISKSNAYQMQGWKNFQTIKKVLSDEKAEELYLQTDGLYKNLQDIQNYLSGDLLKYFNNAIVQLKTSMATIKSEFESLKNLGLDLKKEIERYTQTTEQEEKEALVEQIAEEKKPEVKKGWTDTIFDFWSSLKEKLYGLWSSITGLFGKKTIPAPVQPEKEPANAVTEKHIEESSPVEQ